MTTHLRRAGERNGAAKLTVDAVREIRSRYRPGASNRFKRAGNVSELAAEFRVNPRTIRSIVYGETWGWLD